MSLLHLTSDPDHPDLLLRCQQFLDTLPVPCDLPPLLAQLHNSTSPILKLLEAELLLYFSPDAIDSARLDALFRQLAPLSMNNTLNHGSVPPEARVKYHDLLTDYHYLLSPKVKSVRLMDLITKKINALANAPENPVVDLVQLKILVYHLLSDSDYRHRSVGRYLDEAQIAEKVANSARGGPLASYMARGSRIVPLQDFHSLVQYLGSSFYVFSRVLSTHSSQFVDNFLDANLSLLPRYYESISFQRIHSLLLGDAEPRDLEALVFSMIASNKFPHGAWIDQLSGVVHFEEKPEKHDLFTTHIRKVCEQIDRIS